MRGKLLPGSYLKLKVQIAGNQKFLKTFSKDRVRPTRETRRCLTRRLKLSRWDLCLLPNQLDRCLLSLKKLKTFKMPRTNKKKRSQSIKNFRQDPSLTLHKDMCMSGTAQSSQSSKCQNSAFLSAQSIKSPATRISFVKKNKNSNKSSFKTSTQSLRIDNLKRSLQKI